MPTRSTASARTRRLLSLTFALVAAGLVVSPFGCGSDAIGPEDASVVDTRDDDSGNLSDSDSRADASLDARGDGGDAGDGTYWQGPYLCCGEGQGRSCCPPEMLPDPGAGRTATCFKYGGTLGKCTGLGERLEAKDICSLCCPGLNRVPSLAPAEGGPIRIGNVDCKITGYASVFGCTACGDGVCGDGENACNCPGDCGNPLDAGTVPKADPIGDSGGVPEGGPVGPGGSPEGGIGSGPGDASAPDAISPPPPPPPFLAP